MGSIGKTVFGVILFLVSALLQISLAKGYEQGQVRDAGKKTAVKKTIAKKTGTKATTTKKRVVKKRRSIRTRAAPASRSVKAAKAGSAKKKRLSKRIKGASTRSAGIKRMLKRPKATAAAAAAAAASAAAAGEPALRSNVAFALDAETSRVLFEKNSDAPLPIASLTKLMTALVVLDANQDMDEKITVTSADIDRIKGTSSRLPIGARLTRGEMLRIALMSSENRAASALGRNYPGGLRAFVTEMNMKALTLGMRETRFVEPTGLSSGNVASARDLAKLVLAAREHPRLTRYSTHPKHVVHIRRGELQYVNTNRLLGQAGWEIVLQKTGYIREAGRCLVMLVNVEGRPVVMVFLGADSGAARFSDADALRSWVLENGELGLAARTADPDDQG